MKLWRRRDYIAQAIAWKLEKEAVLSAEVQILETLLRSSREELAEVRNLHGLDLMARFGWESQAGVDVAAMQEFLDECADIWIEGSQNLKVETNAA